MTGLLLALFASPSAFAATIAVPSVKPTVAAAVAVARPGDIIEVDDDDAAWDAALATSLDITVDLTIRSDDTDRVQIPGLRVSEGATLTLEHVELGSEYALEWSPDGSTVESSRAAIFVFESALRGTDIALPGVGVYGLLAVDADVELTGLYASGYGNDAAVRAAALFLPSRLSLGACELSNNTSGALHASIPEIPGEGADLSVLLDSCLVYGNQGTRGADIRSERAAVAVNNVQFSGSTSTLEGGSIYVLDADLVLEQSTFASVTTAAGAVTVQATEQGGASVTLDQVVFADITATGNNPGGALRLINTYSQLEAVTATRMSAVGGALVYQEDGSFWSSHFHASDYTSGPLGGAVLLRRYEDPWNETALVRHAVFCQGRADGSVTGTALSTEGYALDLHTSVFQALSDAAGEAVYVSGAGASIDQNTFTASEVFTFIKGNLATISATNNIFDGAEYGVVLADSGSRVTGDYDLWNGLTDYVLSNGGLVQIVGGGTVTDAPRFWAGFDSADCYSDPYLAYGSPAIDAGDPTVTDGDGTRSDIGAFGGPEMTLPDQDGDSWTIGQDCDDDDERIHPETGETWYDGVDQDCQGDDDFDADGDGYPGGGSGNDCDDTNPEIHPDQVEVPGDGIDQNCDGVDGEVVDDSGLDDSGLDDSGTGDSDAPGTRIGALRGGCAGCASGDPAPALPALLLLALVYPMRSRRSSGSRSGS